MNESHGWRNISISLIDPSAGRNGKLFKIS